MSVNHPDPPNETKALQTLVAELEPFGHDARRRMLMYLADRYRVLVDKCPERSPVGIRSGPSQECFLPRGHDGAHVGHGREWHTTEDERE